MNGELMSQAPESGDFPLEYQINKRLLRKAVDRAVDSYDAHAQVFDEIARRVFERLDLLQDSPARILDLGTGSGRHLADLQARYPKAFLIGADIGLSALHAGAIGGWRLWPRKWRTQPGRVCMDAGHSWPFADASFELVVSNMLLPWLDNAAGFASELHRVLAPGGTFFISTAGPDTLVELRNAWDAIDRATHVNALLDMHDLGDVLNRAGLADPVLDTERIDVQYKDVGVLLAELRATGCTCVLHGRRRGLTSPRVQTALASHYAQPQLRKAQPQQHELHSAANDVISATLELVVAHGWKQTGSAEPRNPGEQVVQFQPKTWRSRR
jgi:malonyl-CoA O-methyltransferase